MDTLDTSSTAAAPFASVSLAPPRVTVRQGSGGIVYLSSPLPLADTVATTDQWLRHWAKAAANRCFLAAREGAGGDWQEYSYAAVDDMVDRVATALLARGLGPERPIVLLSGNSIKHALLVLAALRIGVPVVPVSPAYSLMSRDCEKVRHILTLTRPGLVYVEAIPPFAGALSAIEYPREMELLVGIGDDTPPVTFRTVTPFDDLTATVSAPGKIEQASASVTADTVAKILFTSGSTGLPKGVINTHRMIVANQSQIVQTQPFIAEAPPVLVDWLPWNHTFGGNYTFNLVLSNGGTLYIDGGRPLAGLFDESLKNLRDVAPTLFFNVPAAFALLVPELEKDPTFRNHFFSRLQQLFYAGAGLPQDLWQRLETLSLAARGARVFMASSWGSTETAPLATAVHWPIRQSGVIGLPVPGVTLKLVPGGGKREVRVKGPNVTPGYYRDDALTAAAFDDEGFYCIGDAVTFADEADPNKGLVFDGRVSEDFKLATGTWVSTGTLRLALLAACDGLLQDAVIAGESRDEIGVLAWLNPVRAAQYTDNSEGLPMAPEIHAALRQAVQRYNEKAPASSTRIGRLLLLTTPPDSDAGEITDKGYINQRAVLAARAGAVIELYAADDGTGSEVVLRF